MPKVSRVGNFRKAAAAGETTTTATETATKTDANNEEDQTLSRGQRKRMAKRDQYLKREKLVMSALKLKKEEEQKKRIDGLDAIKEALMATISRDSDKEEKETPKVNFLKTSKSRNELVEKEVTQISLVLDHPAFQADPLATIREHLKNTLANDAAQQKKQAILHEKERREKEEQKKIAKKEQNIKKKRRKFKATKSKAR